MVPTLRTQMSRGGSVCRDEGEREEPYQRQRPFLEKCLINVMTAQCDQTNPAVRGPPKEAVMP
jgi:hypothetical protein